MRSSRRQFIWERFPRPRKQFADPVDRVVGDAREDVAQVSFRIETIELGRLCRSTNYAERFRRGGRLY
jgi:hypothetical protein